MANLLITGCSSGFGLLTALRFARAGDRARATMRTPAKAPAELTDAIAREKLPISLARLDLCDPASVATAVRDAGEVDVLVNNVGIELRSPIEDADDEDVKRQFGNSRPTSSAPCVSSARCCRRCGRGEEGRCEGRSRPERLEPVDVGPLRHVQHADGTDQDARDELVPRARHAPGATLLRTS
jgi:hypothetical protein